jgi:Protein of unknown function (DUF3147)
MVKRGWRVNQVIIGGLFVSAFAVLGDSLKPKSFAGLFGAAPSVALATLLLTIRSQGVVFAATERMRWSLGTGLFRLRQHRLLPDNALQVAGINCRDGLYYHLARYRPRDRRGHMIISVDFSGLRKTKWHEYAVRFVFGGLMTVGAGLIVHRFGPEVGGLFLAFPAIFPASVTLVEKHETQNKKRAVSKAPVADAKPQLWMLSAPLSAA